MTTDEAIKILKAANEWRRGVETPQPDVKKYGEALDHITALHTGRRTEPCCKEMAEDIELFVWFNDHNGNRLMPSWKTDDGLRRFNHCPYCGAYIRDIKIPAK